MQGYRVAEALEFIPGFYYKFFSNSSNENPANSLRIIKIIEITKGMHITKVMQPTLS